MFNNNFLIGNFSVKKYKNFVLKIPTNRVKNSKNRVKNISVKKFKNNVLKIVLKIQSVLKNNPLLNA